MAAVAYIRVSTDKQAKQSHNLPNQRAKVRGHCDRVGFSIMREFIETESARTDDRPAFQEMLKFCRKNHGKVTHVVVADLSRLARNVVDQGTTIAELQRLGIALVSVDEPILDATAAGRLSANMIGAMNQFFSDSLSERIRYRMRAGFEAGRYLRAAPIGYMNAEKALVRDPDRAPLVKKAFELVASGSSMAAAMSLTTALGLRTRRGNQVAKQSFARMLQNPIYVGWLVSGDDRVKGTHEPLISDALFQSVQERLNGKSSLHKTLNEDFPLRGIVRCEKCDKPLTAGWVKGRKERYARYWCWNKGCRAVGVSREVIEGQFVSILERIQPDADLLAQLPEVAAREWESRKGRIAKDAETLSKRLAEQRTLNQKAIRARLDGELTEEDLSTLKRGIAEEMFQIEAAITALDSERSTMQDMMQQAKLQVINLAETWKRSSAEQRQEMVRAFFPAGIWYSQQMTYFKPRNSKILQLFANYLQDESLVGVPDGI
jgi:site-specific DNA recombinase